VTGTTSGCSSTAAVTVSVNASPALTVALSSTAVCNGASATITASGADTFSWSTSATTTSIVVTPTSTSVYSVVGTFTSNLCASSVTRTLTVGVSPTVTIAPPSSTISCAGTNVTLTASGASTYSWSSGSSASTAVVAPSAFTTYTVTGSSPGCANAFATINLDAYPLPTVGIVASPSAICIGGSAQLGAFGIGATSYSWTTPSSTNAVINVTPAANTTYSVRGTSSVGCVGSAVVTVTVNALPVITIAPASPTVCAGVPFTYTASGASTYTWNNNSSLTNSTAVLSVPTNTIYSVVGISSVGCVSSKTVGVVTNSVPVVTFAPATPYTVCPGTPISFTANGASTYTWSNPVSNASTVALTPTANTVYTLTGASSGSCVATVTIGVTTLAAPVLTVATSVSTVCANSPVTFTASGASTYTWSAGSATNPIISVTPTANTSYTVTGTSTLGCVSSNTFVMPTFVVPVIGILALPSASPCSGVQATLSVGGASTYTWNGSTVGSSVIASTTGVYTVVGTSTAGCVSAAVTVAVGSNTLPIVVVSPASSTVCSASAATFTAGGANTYTWNSSTATGSVFGGFPIANTVYTVVGASPAGCTSSQTVGVTVNPLPSPTVTPSFTTVCLNTSISVNVAGANSYTWSNGATTATTVITPTVSGTNSYSVVASTSLGCISVGQLIVITNPLPVVNVTPSSNTVCALTPASFTATGASTYSWSNGGGTNSVANYTPSANAIYTVVGTETVNSCQRTATVSISVNANPAIAVVASSNSVCTGASATLTASGAGATNYTWSVAGSANDATLSVVPTSGSIYTVSGTSTAGCVGTKTVTVGVFPQPNIVASPAQQTLCLNETATITAAGGTSYTWTAFSNTSTGTTFTISPSILTQVSLDGVDANNCVGSTSVIVYVNPCTGLTSNSLNSNMVSVFPNPSNGIFTARFDFEGQKEVRVINAIGQVIDVRSTEGQSEEFNIAQYPKGVYYVRVSSKQASGNYKVIVE
jgi:hypothetical protein